MELEKKVKKILENYNLCDTCLGRQFHELYPKKSNREIGKELRKKLKYKNIGKCYLCNNIFGKLNKYVEKILKKLKGYEFKTFLIGSIFPEDLISREEEFWEEYGVEFCEAIKTNFNREIGKKLKKLLKKNIEFENPDIMLIIDLKKNKIIMQVSSLYIKGEYKKILPKGKVQTIIEKILLKKSKSKRSIFYSAGRLEKEVIISCYRPFIIKLKSPIKRKLNLKEVRDLINKNKSLKVSSLKYVGKEELEELINSKFLITYLIILKLKKLNEKKEIKEKLHKLEGKKIHQNLKNKVRKLRIQKIKLKFEKNNLILELKVPSTFSINSFLNSNLRDIIGNFKIKKIIIKNYEKIKK